MSSGAIAAVDLGASSGRVVVGHVGPGVVRFEEIHRFANDPVVDPDGLYTDIGRLFREVLTGLRRANATAGPLQTVGIDTWGVDYGVVDASGELLGDPVHYRDARHRRGMELVHGIASPEHLYATNGLQVLPFNTLYQLAAAQQRRPFATTETLLLLPDLLAFWMTGVRAAETTNASTTGLLDARSRHWADSLIATLGLPVSLFAPLAEPGQTVGRLLSKVASDAALPVDAVVTAVGSHDTASAVVAVPAETDDFAYVSSGTWGLAGLELERPILTEASRIANFTNEAGVDGRVRYLRNVMGLWLLQETLRSWERAGEPQELDRLLREAAAAPSGGPVINPDDPVFLPPGDMAERIESACDQTAQPRPASKAGMVRCILDSLASAFARAIGDASKLARHDAKVVHVVGGGARNELLCQLTADACGRPVVAGPFEATALGNILIQARSIGLAAGTLESLRALVRASQPLRRYEPSLRSQALND